MKRCANVMNMCLFAFMTVPFVLTGCSSDDDCTEPQPKEDPCTEVASSVVVMTYDSFAAPADVTITSADTTQIEVNKTYLKNTKKEIAAGSVLSIWRTIETRPFIRKVTGVRDNGDKLVVTSTPGDVGDVFNNVDADLSTTLYINPDKSLDAHERYVNPDDGIIHPAVLIAENEGTDNTDADNTGTPAPSTPQAYTAEQLLAAQGGAGSTWHIISNTTKSTQIFQPENYIKFGIEDASISTWADIDISLKVKWLKLRKLDFMVHAGIDAQVPVVLDVMSSCEWSKDVTLARLPTCTAVFFIDGVPVGVTVDPSLQLSLDSDASATTRIKIPLDVHAELTLGPSYNGSWGVKNNFSASAQAPVDYVGFMGRMKASASASVFLRVGSSLYDTAGPAVKTGPTVETVNVVTLNEESARFHLNTTGTCRIDGEVEADLKVAKWASGSYKYTLPGFCENQLWKWEHEY